MIKKILISTRGIDRNRTRTCFKSIKSINSGYFASLLGDLRLVFETQLIHRVFRTNPTDWTVSDRTRIHFYEIELESESDLVFLKLGGSDGQLKFFNKKLKSSYSYGNDCDRKACWVTSVDQLESVFTTFVELQNIEPIVRKSTTQWSIDRPFKEVNGILEDLNRHDLKDRLDFIIRELQATQNANYKFNDIEKSRFNAERQTILDNSLNIFKNSIELIIDS